MRPQASPRRNRRFRRLPVVEVCGLRVPVAATRRARLLGLALLDREVAGPGLLIPRCRSVHTFGMRFTLDLVFLDAEMNPVSTRRSVPPARVAADRRARAVLELPTAALDEPPSPRTSSLTNGARVDESGL